MRELSANVLHDKGDETVQSFPVVICEASLNLVLSKPGKQRLNGPLECQIQSLIVNATQRRVETIC